jgi:hypothetical protein
VSGRQIGRQDEEEYAMDWILELVSEFALWGSLALLAWGAALCLEEMLAGGARQAERAGPAAARAAPAHAGEH